MKVQWAGKKEFKIWEVLLQELVNRAKTQVQVFPHITAQIWLFVNLLTQSIIVKKNVTCTWLWWWLKWSSKVNYRPIMEFTTVIHPITFSWVISYPNILIGLLSSLETQLTLVFQNRLSICHHKFCRELHQQENLLFSHWESFLTSWSTVHHTSILLKIFLTKWVIINLCSWI